MTLYDVLEVSPKASPEVIKNAYKALAKMYHPDMFLSEEEKKNAEEKMKCINNAYEILSDRSKRAQYDKNICHQEYKSADSTYNGSDEYNSTTEEPKQSYNPGFKPKSQANTYKEDPKIDLEKINIFRNYLIFILIGLVLSAAVSYAFGNVYSGTLTYKEAETVYSLSQVIQLIVKAAFALFCWLFAYEMTRKRFFSVVIGILSAFSVIIWGVIIYLFHKSNSLLAGYENRKFNITHKGIILIITMIAASFIPFSPILDFSHYISNSNTNSSIVYQDNDVFAASTSDSEAKLPFEDDSSYTDSEASSNITSESSDSSSSMASTAKTVENDKGTTDQSTNSKTAPAQTNPTPKVDPKSTNSEPNSVVSPETSDSENKVVATPIQNITIGSTKNDVKSIMGTPTKTDDYLNWWYYDYSIIEFDSRNRVIAWSVSGTPLKVSTGDIEPSAPIITIGSSKSDVTKAMGTPTKIDDYLNWWYYDYSIIEFDTRNKVIAWSISGTPLKVSTGNIEPNAPIITIGSSKSDVTKAMGTPTKIDDYLNWWYYDYSIIEFDSLNKVVKWDINGTPLKVK